ncbi:hypothetical protein BH09VER1_BH09VER1_12050 [soil metagenome]
MNKDDVAKALEKLATQPVPELPIDFEQRVWREIRFRKAAQARESFWSVLVAACLRPGLAFSASAVTLAVAVAFGTIENITPHSTAHLSLNLGVFSTDAPALPSTLLAHGR